MKFDLLDVYAGASACTAAVLSSPERLEQSLETMRAHLQGTLANASTLHGIRTQSLFEAIVASLGAVDLLKQEDAGNVYSHLGRARPPDFRIASRNGWNILVEVKNKPQSATTPFRVRAEDFQRLREYSLLAGGRLMFAIYWTQPNLWTLVDADRFRSDGTGKVSISLADAMLANEMHLVGDYWVGSEWPIDLILTADTTSPRQVVDGQVAFTVGAAEVRVRHRKVIKQAEVGIAMRLAMYGPWDVESTAQIETDVLKSITHSFAPGEPPPDDQGVAIHGPLSSVLSVMYNHATLDADGSVSQLHWGIDPRRLRTLIPKGFQGEALKLWYFDVHPANETSE